MKKKNTCGEGAVQKAAINFNTQEMTIFRGLRWSSHYSFIVDNRFYVYGWVSLLKHWFVARLREYSSRKTFCVYIYIYIYIYLKESKRTRRFSVTLSFPLVELCHFSDFRVNIVENLFKFLNAATRISFT